MPYRQLKQNDATTISFQLTDADATETDLTGDTVYITSYFSGNDSQSAGIVTSVDGVEVSSYVDRDQGRVAHKFNPDDFPYAGQYLIEFEVDNGTASERYPKVRYYEVQVDERLGVISTGDISATGSLASDVDANGNDILNADVLEGSTLRDRDTGDTADIGSIIAGGGGGDGTAVALDLGNDDTLESSGILEIATTGDANNVATEPEPGKLLWDLSKNWPTADIAAALATGALDAIGDIDATLRSGSDATLITGTAGTAGNLPQFNGDGDIVDSGQAASDVGSGGTGSGAKTFHRFATDWGTNSGAEQVIKVIPASLIDEATALWSTLYDANDNVDQGATNGSFKLRLYDGVANVGSSDSSTFVRWNAGERFTGSPPYLSLTAGNDAVLTIENDTGDPQTVDFGFEYQ